MNNKEIKNPKIKTKIVHSKSNNAWNIVGASLGGKYKIARVPYVVSSDEDVTEINKAEAYNHAKFINYCFNNSTYILKGI